MRKLKNNEELRAYFFEYIASNVAVEFSDIFKVREIDKLRFQKEIIGGALQAIGKNKTAHGQGRGAFNN